MKTCEINTSDNLNSLSFRFQRWSIDLKDDEFPIIGFYIGNLTREHILRTISMYLSSIKLFAEMSDNVFEQNNWHYWLYYSSRSWRSKWNYWVCLQRLPCMWIRTYTSRKSIQNTRKGIVFWDVYGEHCCTWGLVRMGSPTSVSLSKHQYFGNRWSTCLATRIAVSRIDVIANH